MLVENGFFEFAHMLAQLAAFALVDVRERGQLSMPTIQLMSDLVALQSVIGTCMYT